MGAGFRKLSVYTDVNLRYLSVNLGGDFYFACISCQTESLMDSYRMVCPWYVEIQGLRMRSVYPLYFSEPFIVPSLFEKYQTGAIQAQDEWTLSQAMRADTSPGGGINQLETHYQEFIVNTIPNLYPLARQ
jgi:hypothetical protein